MGCRRLVHGRGQSWDLLPTGVSLQSFIQKDYKQNHPKIINPENTAAFLSSAPPKQLFPFEVPVKTKLKGSVC